MSRVLAGDNFSIECAIGGWPTPIIEWEKYGDVLPERRHEVIHGTLYLYDLRLDDRGTYICRASSSSGLSDLAYTALLEVLGKKKIINDKNENIVMHFDVERPKLVQRPDSLIQTTTEEEQVSIKCGFRGRPEPTISWLYNGEELVINGSPVTGIFIDNIFLKRKKRKTLSIRWNFVFDYAKRRHLSMCWSKFIW